MIIMHAGDVPGGMHHPVTRDIIGEIMHFSWRLRKRKSRVEQGTGDTDPGMGFRRTPEPPDTQGVVSFTPGPA